MKWYTADPHFGHRNIIKYCKRPFKSVAEMDEILLKNLHECVKPEDELYILGDFSFRSRKGTLEVFERLPGAKKHLVIGNHDGAFVRGLPWDTVENLLEIQDGNAKYVLCHYPMVTWNKARRGAVQLFGHVHDLYKGWNNCLNVGVDVWDYKPITTSEIRRRAKTLKVSPLFEKSETKNN